MHNRVLKLLNVAPVLSHLTFPPTRKRGLQEDHGEQGRRLTMQDSMTFICPHLVQRIMCHLAGVR